MSEPKFTPGPWRYRPLEFDDWGVVRSSEPEHARIIARATALPIPLESTGAIELDLYAECCEMERHRRAKTDPYEANARLIAAAPELYEACSEILEGLEQITPMGKWRLIDEWKAKARAALAMAKGETS